MRQSCQPNGSADESRHPPEVKIPVKPRLLSPPRTVAASRSPASRQRLIRPDGLLYAFLRLRHDQVDHGPQRLVLGISLQAA